MLFAQLGMTTFAENTTTSFSDTKGHYAESIINQWVRNGFINGYPDGTFKPGANVTRAQFVALLNRAFKLDSATGTTKTFSDVTKDNWYYNDVMLATRNRIIEGYNNQFRPEDPITREDASVIISRYLALSEAFDPTKLNNLSDKNSISEYATEHVAAMAELNIITTKTGNKFEPKVAITRADTVVWLDNAYNMAKGESGITGKIYANNKVLADATIVIEKQDDYKAAATLKTNYYGTYSAKLSAGTYNVIATKDNMVAFKSEIVVRSNFKSIVRFSVEEGQVVTAALNDINGESLTGTTIYFKTNPYFPAKSDSNGNLSVVLPKNRDYEASYVKNGELISLRKFSTKGRTGVYSLGNINTSLGIERTYSDSSGPFSNNSDSSGNSGDNGSGWYPSSPWYPSDPTPLPTDPTPTTTVNFSFGPTGDRILTISVDGISVSGMIEVDGYGMTVRNGKAAAPNAATEVASGKSFTLTVGSNVYTGEVINK